MGFSARFSSTSRPVGRQASSLATSGPCLAPSPGLLLSGIVTRFLPVSALPSVDIPTIVVFAGRPGADPETMANSIAAPLERRLGEIAGVTEITSTSAIGNTAIIIQFDIDRDINGAAHDVQAAINAATADLPSDLPMRPFYRKFNPADAPIMTHRAVLGHAVRRADLRRRRHHPGAAPVAGRGRVAGAGERRGKAGGARAARSGSAWPPPACRRQDVYTAIRGTNVLEPTGGFEGPDRAETIGINGQLSQAAEYAPLVHQDRATAPSCGCPTSPASSTAPPTPGSRAWNGKTPAILLNDQQGGGCQRHRDRGPHPRAAAAIDGVAAAGHQADGDLRPHHHDPRQRHRRAVHAC